MPFYLKKNPVEKLIDGFADANELGKRMPDRAAHFDQFAEDRKRYDDQAAPGNWGKVLAGAGEYKHVARIPEPVWMVMMQMKDAGLCPDPLTDDPFFYGFMFRNPAYQAYTMKRSTGR
jgi:hypothetical protein